VDSPGALTLGFEGSGVQSVTLGGVRYDVRLGTGGSDTESYLTADVTCTHDAPEPATLALAAVGLLGAAGLRRRR
jgi:MYXO-CTERM domain-containing protein